MVLDVNQDLQRKYQLVASGHIIYMMGITSYSYKVKNISVHIIHMVAHKTNMKHLFEDIGNFFPNAYKNEKVFL